MRITPTQKRLLAVLLMYLIIIVVGHYGGEHLRESLGFNNPDGKPRHARYFLLFGTVLYVVLLAAPFVPGIEIGVALFAAFGKEVIPVIYAASIIALTASYLVGRTLSLRAIASLFRFLRLGEAEDFVRQLESLTSNQRLELLVASAPTDWVPFLIKFRYIALAVALNIPGNAIIGGGGGIAIVAGMSGLFRITPFITVVAIAVAPIPLVFYIMGKW